MGELVLPQPLTVTRIPAAIVSTAKREMSARIRPHRVKWEQVPNGTTAGAAGKASHKIVDGGAERNNHMQPV